MGKITLPKFLSPSFLFELSTTKIVDPGRKSFVLRVFSWAVIASCATCLLFIGFPPRISPKIILWAQKNFWSWYMLYWYLSFMMFMYCSLIIKYPFGKNLFRFWLFPTLYLGIMLGGLSISFLVFEQPSNFVFRIMSLSFFLGFAFLMVIGSMRSAVEMDWETLSDLKSIPIVSPVFCFGAPAMWSKSLELVKVPIVYVSVYTSLSVIAGCVFLLHLLIVGLLGKNKKGEAKGGRTILLPVGTEHPKTEILSESILVMACWTTFVLGLYLFSIVLLDLILVLLWQMAGLFK